MSEQTQHLSSREEHAPSTASASSEAQQLDRDADSEKPTAKRRKTNQDAKTAKTMSQIQEKRGEMLKPGSPEYEDAMSSFMTKVSASTGRPTLAQLRKGSKMSSGTQPDAF